MEKESRDSQSPLVPQPPKMGEYLSGTQEHSVLPEGPLALPKLPPPRVKWRRIAGVLLFGLLSGGIAGAGAIAFYVFTPIDPAGAEKEFIIEPGTRVVEVTAALEREGFVRNGLAFATLLRFQGREADVKAGTFILSPAMTSRRISDILTAQAPPERDLRTTVPEGFTVVETAERLAESGAVESASIFLDAVVRISPYDFLAQCAAALGSASCEVPVRTLEGYLFPDTYRFRKQATPNEIVAKFLENFDRQFSPQLRSEAMASGRSLSDIVTMASLVEREAKFDADRPIIAGILFKRLEIGMPLQVDATVLYAKSEGGLVTLPIRDLTLEDLQIDSLYNTYRVAGLPPGPIASPGLKSLLAALRPEPSLYLFYLHAPDGTTVYSRTLQEHNAAKDRYLR